jgi:NADH-quinone oxidoreductase subunit N
MSYLELLKLVSPETVVAVTALAVLGVQLAWPRRRAYCGTIAALGLVLAISAVAFILPAKQTLLDGMIVVDPLTSLFKIICLALACVTVLLARPASFTKHEGEFLALLLFATIGLMLLVGSEELLMIFLGLELTGLSLYVMTGFDKSSARSAEAGLKYFLFGSTVSAFTLFGISLIYGMCGSTQLAVIAQKTTVLQPVPPLLAAGIVMTLAGLAFKIAAAPLHLWAPDAYEAAPVPAAAFIASGSKVAAFFVLGKILLTGFGPVHSGADWSPLIAALATASITIGNLVALAQKNVRRLLAYSAVAHSGYTLLGLLAGRDGFAATLFYTTIYGITLVGAFGVVALVRNETGGDDISNFTGLRTHSPLLATCMCVFLLSLAGLPPFAGFFGKFYLFAVALRHGWLWLVVLALAGSLASLYYYLAILKAILVDESTDRAAAIIPDAKLRLCVALLGAAVLLLGIFPDSLLLQILGGLR